VTVGSGRLHRSATRAYGSTVDFRAANLAPLPVADTIEA
jgi:hypothetical protein